MATLRHLLLRGLVVGALWAVVGGVIAGVLLPIYLYGAHPWDFGFSWRIIVGSGSPGAPARGEVLRAAAGFAVLGALVGFLGGFFAGMQGVADDTGK